MDIPLFIFSLCVSSLYSFSVRFSGVKLKLITGQVIPAFASVICSGCENLIMLCIYVHYQGLVPNTCSLGHDVSVHLLLEYITYLKVHEMSHRIFRVKKVIECTDHFV